MVSALRVDAESRRVGPSRYKLGARDGARVDGDASPLSTPWEQSAKSAQRAGLSPQQVFKRRPRQKGAEDWFGSKRPFLPLVGSSTRKGLRTRAAGSPGQHVLAARRSVAAGKHHGSVFAESGAYGGLLLSLITLPPFLF